MNLPQQNTINQYTPTSNMQSVYNYTFYIPSSDSIAVYVTAPGVAPNVSTDLKILNTDYTVQGAGNQLLQGGTVTFINVPNNGSTVTLVRDVPFQINTQFAAAQTFSGANLDAAFLNITLMLQQLESYFTLRGLQYLVNSVLTGNQDGNNYLPGLNPGEIWYGSTGGAIINVPLEQSPDVGTLRGELASQIDGGDGCALIGYFNETPYYKGAYTLAAFLNNLPAYISQVISNNNPASGQQTGDMKWSWNPNPLPGWINYADGTIGSAASQATTYAGDDCLALFTNYWNYYPDLVVTSGRGEDAPTDFAANKQITLPVNNYHTLINQAGATNINPALVPGGNFGEATHSLTVDELASHTHTLDSGGVNSSLLIEGAELGPDHNYVRTYNITKKPRQNPNLVSVILPPTTGTTGAGNAHNNMPPSTAAYLQIKL